MHQTLSNVQLISPKDKMSKPHRTGTSGQYNDEYNDIAHEKMRSKHYVPREKPVAWRTTPLINNLPGSCDDEYFDEYNIFTSVDLSMVRNASANALVALTSRTFDEEVDVTEENCLRVGYICHLFYLGPRNFEISNSCILLLKIMQPTHSLLNV